MVDLRRVKEEEEEEETEKEGERIKHTCLVAGLVSESAGKVAETGEGRASGASVQSVRIGIRCATTVGGRRADLAEPFRPPGHVCPAETLRRVSLPTSGSRTGPSR